MYELKLQTWQITMLCISWSPFSPSKKILRATLSQASYVFSNTKSRPKINQNLSSLTIHLPYASLEILKDKPHLRNDIMRTEIYWTKCFCYNILNHVQFTATLMSAVNIARTGLWSESLDSLLLYWICLIPFPNHIILSHLQYHLVVRVSHAC